MGARIGQVAREQGIARARDGLADEVTRLLQCPPTIADESARLDRLAGVAAVVGDMRALLDHFGPDAVAMVRATPSRTDVDSAAATTFLSGYSGFLARAGSDSKVLYEAQQGAQDVTADATDIHPVLTALDDELREAATESASLQDAIQ